MKFKELTEEEVKNLSANTLLLALWYDLQGDWEKAHQITQEKAGKEAARVHAYLHRKEGDSWNAGYWYRQAGTEPFTGTLEEEAENLIAAIKFK